MEEDRGEGAPEEASKVLTKLEEEISLRPGTGIVRVIFSRESWAV